jgi:hypothetical protein
MKQEKSITRQHTAHELNLRQTKIAKLKKNQAEFDTRKSEHSFELR